MLAPCGNNTYGYTMLPGTSSDQITANSVNFVRSQIVMKNDTKIPYYGRINTVKNVITDMDSFPYQRYFRGVYNSSEPIVFEREAGWRPRENQCYREALSYNLPEYPNHCFETACSTVYPCYPQYLRKYADKNELDVFLNRKCVDKSP